MYKITSNVELTQYSGFLLLVDLFDKFDKNFMLNLDKYCCIIYNKIEHMFYTYVLCNDVGAPLCLGDVVAENITRREEQ